LLLVKHVEDAAVVLDLFLGIFAPDVELIGSGGLSVLLMPVDVCSVELEG
jgi:hypothetical protein